MIFCDVLRILIHPYLEGYIWARVVVYLIRVAGICSAEIVHTKLRLNLFDILEFLEFHSRGRSNWILNRKWKYYICGLREVILKVERDVLNKPHIKYFNFQCKILSNHPVGLYMSLSMGNAIILGDCLNSLGIQQIKYCYKILFLLSRHDRSELA